MLFKALILQRWHALSDPALEEGLKDRLSFRCFAGLALSDPIPLEFCALFDNGAPFSINPRVIPPPIRGSMQEIVALA